MAPIIRPEEASLYNLLPWAAHGQYHDIMESVSTYKSQYRGKFPLIDTVSDKKMRYTSHILSTVCLLISSCASSSIRDFDQQTERALKYDEQTKRALKREDQADLVVFYSGPIEFDIGLNEKVEDGVRTPSYFDSESLAKHLADTDIKREMVVVIMAKITQMQSDSRFKSNVDCLEAYFK